MPFDMNPLENAVRQLAAGLAAANAAPDNELLRDGVIQRFEYTYELSHKTLRRYLAATEPSPEIPEDLSFPNLIRLGSERGFSMAAGMHGASSARPEVRPATPTTA